MATAAARDLSFNVAAIDRTAKSFEKIAVRLERLDSKLDRIDRKRVNVDVDVDTDRAMRKIDQATDVTTSASAGAIRVATSNVYVFAGIVLAVIAGLPTAAMLAATGVVLAFGLGLAGIGIAAAAQSKGVRKEFTGLSKHVGGVLKDISKPFRGTLKDIAKIARDVFDTFAPVLEGVFTTLAPAVTGFVRSLGRGLERLAPALGPMADAFASITDALGPHIETFMGDLGASLAHLADVVNDNADSFALFIGMILRAVPLAITAVAKLASLFAFLMRVTFKVNAAILGALVGILKFAKMVTGAMHAVFGALINAAAKAFGWLPGIGPKLRKAAADFAEFRKNHDRAMDGAISKAEEWRQAQLRASKRLELKADIRDLEGKLRTAKRKLKDPALTKAQKKEIRADITDLETKIRKAKKRLKSIKDETVNIRGVWIPPSTTSISNKMSGRFDGQASGGPVHANRSYLVGERGPEILTLGGMGGNITPNRKLGQGGSDSVFEGNLVLDSGEFLGKVRGVMREHDRDVMRRARAGTGVNA